MTFQCHRFTTGPPHRAQEKMHDICQEVLGDMLFYLPEECDRSPFKL